MVDNGLAVNRVLNVQTQQFRHFLADTREILRFISLQRYKVDVYGGYSGDS